MESTNEEGKSQYDNARLTYAQVDPIGFERAVRGRAQRDLQLRLEGTKRNLPPEVIRSIKHTLELD